MQKPDSSSSFLHMLLIFGLTFGLLLGFPPNALAGSLGVAPQQATDTATPTTPPPTDTQQPTEPIPTNTRIPSAGATRPLVVVVSYTPSEDRISAGLDFTLKVRVTNKGQETANNVVAIFTPGMLMPRDTGGVVAVGTMAPGKSTTLTQPLTAGYEIWGKLNASIEMQLTYTDASGTIYADKFVLSLPVYTASVQAATATFTPTPTAANTQRPQLVISSYSTNVSILQPGAQFMINMSVQNMGSALAKRVTMIVGGGSVSAGSTNGTPDTSGGTSGSGGEFTNFAPIGSSNVQTLGDLPAGNSLSAKQPLIVNVSTNPGAYPMKVSFSYVDERGNRYTDDQVITLLVYSIPQVEVNFYQAVPSIFAGQPTSLPIQVINLGRKTAVLGNMHISAPAGQLTNNVALVGNLDPGGFFPLDAMLIPEAAGSITLTITINYTDDFNQAQQIIRQLPIAVLESPMVEPGGETPGGKPGIIGTQIPGGGLGPGEPQPAAQESFWQKAWRFVRGLLGLDSTLSTEGGGGTISSPAQPVEPSPSNSGGKPLKGP